MAELAAYVSRLEAVTARLESLAGAGGAVGAQAAAALGGAPGAPVSAVVTAYDAILQGAFATFVACSTKIGGEVKSQTDMVQAAFAAQREFLRKASLCKAPPQQQLISLLQPMSEKISQIQEFRESNRRSALFNHLSTVSESISALGWVTVAPAPGPFVKEMSDAGMFYSNRVLKEFKEKDKTHVEWSRAWTTVFTEMVAYIKQYHTTGVAWNAKGVDASSLGSGGAPPPPPGPPPPPPPVLAPSGGASDPDATKNALFADLNKGGDVTKGLKKVSSDQMTHKNPALRTGPQPFKPSPQSTPQASRAAAPPVNKPPKCELDGKKWNVEYQNGNRNIVISDVNTKQSVYIFRCTDSTVQVKGKVNSITLDGCKKVAVVFEDAIAALEMINCQSVQAQVTGKVPTISIDKTDGCQVYLSKDCLKAEFVTAKSSEMNVLIPDKSGEYKEYALPEQFKTIWSGKNFNTTASDINS